MVQFLKGQDVSKVKIALPPLSVSGDNSIERNAGQAKAAIQCRDEQQADESERCEEHDYALARAFFGRRSSAHASLKSSGSFLMR